MPLFELSPPPSPAVLVGKDSVRAATRHRLAMERLGKMRQRHGAGPEDKTCGECVFLVGNGINRVFFKCSKYRISSSEATDWRKKWSACGAFSSDLGGKS